MFYRTLVCEYRTQLELIEVLLRAKNRHLILSAFLLKYRSHQSRAPESHLLNWEVRCREDLEENRTDRSLGHPVIIFIHISQFVVVLTDEGKSKELGFDSSKNSHLELMRALK